MPLHPLAEQFAAITDPYERGRPEYPLAAAGAIAAELGLRSGDRVLDLAAGTGKLTRALLGAGLDVIAVEPQAELRDVLGASVGAERVLEGVAEAIPLPDASVRAVTVAAAFHWFDHAPALAEIRRVLTAGGGLAVSENFPDWGAMPWAHDVGTLMYEARPEHPHFDGPSWQDAVRAAGVWTEPRQIRVTTTTPWQPEQLIDFVHSMSWVAAMSAADRGAMLARVRELVGAHRTPGELPLHSVISLTQLAQ